MLCKCTLSVFDFKPIAPSHAGADQGTITWNGPNVSVLKILRFTLVRLNGPKQQPIYLIVLRNLSNCVLWKFEAAGLAQTQVSNIVANWDGLNSNFHHPCKLGALVS